MLIGDKSKLLFIGDSITDAGRGRPVGEPFGGYGSGYVDQIAALLGTAYPAKGIRVVNVGVSGDQVRDLKKRWQQDVLDHAPDWLSIMIGINDVWRQFGQPWIPERHVALDEYASTLEELVSSVRPKLSGLVLMSPFFLEPDRSEPLRARLDAYGRVMADIALKYKAVFVDTQTYFDQILRDVHPFALSNDRIHVNSMGAMVIARAFLDGVGFEWRPD